MTGRNFFLFALITGLLLAPLSEARHTMTNTGVELPVPQLQITDNLCLLNFLVQSCYQLAADILTVVGTCLPECTDTAVGSGSGLGVMDCGGCISTAVTGITVPSIPTDCVTN